MNPSGSKRYRKVGAALLVLASGLIGAWQYGASEFPQFFEESARGVLPEGFEFAPAVAGVYTMWLHGVEMGNGVESPVEIREGLLPPSARIYVFDGASGNEVPQHSSPPMLRNIHGQRTVSLSEFELSGAGQTIEVKASGLGSPVVLSITPADRGRILLAFLAIAVILAVSLSLSIWLLVSGLRPGSRPTGA